MKKYIENLEEKVSSVLNESLVADAAELVGIEEEDAEERIKGLSFANYIELGNAIDLEDAETVREILSTVAPIEEGKLAKAAAIGTMALGLGAAAADQGTHSTSADDPSWDDPHNVEVSTERSVDNDDNLTDRSVSVKGPNANGEYQVTYLDGDTLKQYVTKTPPKDMKPKQLGKTIAKESNDLLDKPTMSVREIADKHDVPVAEVASQLAIGIKIELEHTNNRKVAKEIALDHLMELPDYYDRLAKMEETASAGASGAGAVGVAAVGGDIGTWDGKAHKKPKKGLKNAGKGIYEDSSDTLYHVTHTKYIPQIQKTGLRPLASPTNWVQQGSGERYGMGEIYVFTSREDAKKWAARMDWDFNQTIGSGEISIVTLSRPEGQDFEKDEADPMSQAGQQGEWLKTYEPIESENIVGVQVFKSMNEADNPYAATPAQPTPQATPPSTAASSIDALAQPTDTAQETDRESNQRKDVDDLTVGDPIEVIDIDGDPTAVKVKNPRGPGETLIVQTDKGEEHIVKKQAVSGTPTIQEMYESALETYESRDPWLPDTPIPDKFYSKKTGKLIKSKAYYDWIESQKKVNEEELSYESALTDRVHEAYNANKTEHSGAKKGKGGYHGRKQDAKRDSNKKRRANDKKAISEVAPPGMEDWIKKRKPEFKDRYGKDWEKVLYATAWKRHNNESIEESDFDWQQADTVDQVDDLGFDPRPEWGTRRGDIMRVVRSRDGLSGLKVKGMSALLGVGDWVELDDGTSQKIVKIGVNTVKLEDGKFHSIKKIRYPIDESLEEDKDEFVKKLQHGDRYFVRREYHIGKKPYDDFEAQVLDVSDTEDTWSGFKHKVRFKDNKGEEIVAWYPEPGKGGLSGRFYDEQLVKAGEKGKYVAGDSRNEWPAVGIDEKFDHYGSDARFIPVEFMGKEVGVVWQEGEGDWHAEVSATGASWGMIDSYKDAVELVQDEAAELVNEGFDPATHVNVEHRDPEGRFIIVHVPPAGYWAVGKGKYQHDIDRTSFDNFDDALEHAELCLSSLGEGFDVNEIRRLAGLKETASAGATGAGAVATAPTAMGGMVRRSPSIYDKPKPKKRTKESSDDGIGRAKKK